MKPPIKGQAPLITGVILAAGLSTRYGQNKLLQPLKGRPLYSYALDAALKSRLGSLVLVCGLELAQNIPGDPRLTSLINPQPQAGQAGSVQIGLSAVPEQSSHVLFLLADQPLITSELINRFCALAAEEVELACLGWEEYLGPPTLIGQSYFAELRGLKGDRGAGSLLRKHREHLRVLQAPHTQLTWDVDRPADLVRIEELLP